MTVLDARAARVPVAEIAPVRDADGSLDERVLSPRDLARVTIPLEPPLGSDATRELTLTHPEGPARTLVVETPTLVEAGYQRLEAR